MKNWTRSARSCDFSRIFKRTTEVVTTKFSSTEAILPGIQNYGFEERAQRKPMFQLVLPGDSEFRNVTL